MDQFQLSVVPGWWNDLKPLLYGYEKCSPGHSFGPAVRHYYLLHYVLDGEGTFLKAGTAYTVHRGDLFVICPEEITTYCASEITPWTYVWLGFDAASTPDFLQDPVLRQPPVRRLFERIRDLDAAGNRQDNIYSLMYDILWQLSTANHPKEPQPRDYAAYAKTYLDLSYMLPVSIQNIAATLHIDRRYLTTLFREAYDITPQAYLMQLRLEQSRLFLSQGYPVTDAASMSGFSDLSNFSRHFKSYYGICPSKHKPKSP